MKWRKFFMIAALAAAFVILILYIAVWIAQPVLKDRLEERLNQLSPGFHFEVGNIRIHPLQPGVDFTQIAVTSKEKKTLQLRIDTLKIQNIRLFKALFSKSYHIGVLSLRGLYISAALTDSGKKAQPLIIPFPLEIDRFTCGISKLEASNVPNIGNVSAQSGHLQLDDLVFAQKDSLHLNQIHKIQMSFGNITVQTADSNYSVILDTIRYSSLKKNLSVARFRLLPSFEHYVFAARMPWQSDRFDADLKQIRLDGFSLTDLIANKILVSKKIEIADARLEAFRDKRKPFNHVTKPSFTEMMYRYPGKLQIDTVVVVNSHIIYLEHNPDAQKAGKITFEKAEFKLTNITNDSLNTGNFNLKGRALLMGESWFSVELVAKHFDPLGTFQVKGSIQKMNISAINPMLEESAFVTVKSGNLAKIEFSFFANQHLAVGDLMMIYDDLNLAFPDPSSEKNPGIITIIKTWLLNKMIIDANPQKDNLPRKGIIRYERDPERFLFNYCVKAIFTGVKTSMIKNK